MLRVYSGDMKTVTTRWRTTCLVTLAAFLGLAAAVYTTGLLPGDVLVRQEVLEGRGTLVHAMARWADYGGTWVVLLPALRVLLAFSHAPRRHWYLWGGVFIAAGGLELLFKLLVGRPRPRGFHWGFPSGHVTGAATFAVLLIYLMSREQLSPAARLVSSGGAAV
jgi:membrane-associated phospholipid phosphatase